MRLFLWGLAIAAAIYLLSAGHILFLPLLFFIPLGGMFGRRRSRAYGGRGWFGGSRYGRW
jgi:hypothetical protein